MTAPAPMFDHDAEQGIIGAILAHASTLALLPKVDADDFHDPRNRQLFGAIRNLEAASKAIDLVTVTDEAMRVLAARGLNAAEHEVDIITSLGLCATRCPIPDNVVEYVGILKRHRTTRDASHLLSASLEAIRSGAVTGDDAVQQVMSGLMRIESGEQVERGRSMGDLIRDEFRQISSDRAAMEAGENIDTGMPTGIEELDKHTGGTPYGVPTYYLARPANGKTTVAMKLVESAVELGNDAPLVYSYEDGWRSFRQRGLAQMSGVPTASIKKREFNRDEMERIGRAASRGLKRPEIIVQAPGMPVEELVRDVKARRMRRSTDRTVGRLVVVDYIQRMPLPNGNGNKNDRMGEISKRLFDLAASEDIAVVVLSQAKREVETRDCKIPQMSDARDCGEIEQDAKMFVSLFRPIRYDKTADPSLLELHLLKNSNGEADVQIDCWWRLETHSIFNTRDEWRAKDRTR